MEASDFRAYGFIVGGLEFPDLWFFRLRMRATFRFWDVQFIMYSVRAKVAKSVRVGLWAFLGLGFWVQSLRSTPEGTTQNKLHQHKPGWRTV